MGGPEELRSTPRITQLSWLSPVPGLPGRKPRALSASQRGTELAVLMRFQPFANLLYFLSLPLLITKKLQTFLIEQLQVSQPPRPEGLRILSLGCRELTQHRPGPAGLPGGLPAVSHFLSMSPITTGLLQEQVLKNQIGGKKKTSPDAAVPSRFFSLPTRPLPLSFLPVLFQLLLDILLHEGNCYCLGLPGT